MAAPHLSRESHGIRLSHIMVSLLCIRGLRWSQLDVGFCPATKKLIYLIFELREDCHCGGDNHAKIAQRFSDAVNSRASVEWDYRILEDGAGGSRKDKVLVRSSAGA